MSSPVVALVTGLPAAGKTTLATRLAAELGERARVLDGDELRRSVSTDLGFDRASRRVQAERAAVLAVEAGRTFEVVLVSIIAPYADDRAMLRAAVEEAGLRFLEVHVATPLRECRRRDPKGLYAAAARGEREHVTGVDDPYEAPLAPDLRIEGEDAPGDADVARALALLRPS